MMPMPRTVKAREASLAGLVWLAVLACGCGGGKSDKSGPSTSCPAPTVTASTTVAGPASDPGTCFLQAQPSSLGASQVQHLGTHTVGESVSFTIPANSAGFSVVSQGVNAATGDVTFITRRGPVTVPNAVVPVTVTAPGGAVFYDDNKDYGDPTLYPAFYASFSPWSSAFTVPNTTPGLDAFKNGVPAGTWSMVVSDYAAECASFGPSGCASGGNTTSTYDITVITRPGPLAASGTVDLRFYLVTNHWGSAATVAATAVADPKTQRFVSTLSTIYEGAGVCVGSVTFVDVAPWARAKYASTIDEKDTGPCSHLGQMFTLAESTDSLNFFLVDDIVQGTTGGSGNVTVGIDGSIPGPSSFGGTVNSGAVVNVSDIGAAGGPGCGASPSFVYCGADSTAYVAAHEGGHWMGLYHVTESTGDSFDPLVDTGTCVCTSCAPSAKRSTCLASSPSSSNPYLVTGADCGQTGASCAGGTNLMFWLLDRNAAGNVTTEQSEVMRSNPVVR
jgi:hypothetical protein